MQVEIKSHDGLRLVCNMLQFYSLCALKIPHCSLCSSKLDECLICNPPFAVDDDGLCGKAHCDVTES